MKNKLLELLQTWAILFKDIPEGTYLNEVYSSLKSQGKSLSLCLPLRSFTKNIPKVIHSHRLIRNWMHPFYKFKLYVNFHWQKSYDSFDSTIFQAPEWIDSEICSRCRFKFTAFNRKVSSHKCILMSSLLLSFSKHHCRACGQTVCQPCSSKNLSLPHLGIDRQVRVCETCFEQLAKTSR